MEGTCNICERRIASCDGKLAHRSISAEKSQYLLECWSVVGHESAMKKEKTK